MAKTKVYAVRKGRQTGLFDTWDECKRMVHGYPGAVYKSFKTKEEADAYLKGMPQTKQPDQTKNSGKHAGRPPEAASRPGRDGWLLPGPLAAYVVGSYDKKIGRYSFGCIFLTPDGELIEKSGSGSEPESLAMRNVAGEMLGAMFAVKWALKHGYQAVNICYDYAGIEQWATHGWKAKKNLTQKYADYMDRCGQRIAITFTKIAAHTGDCYNEAADMLAKEALAGTDGIPEC